MAGDVNPWAEPPSPAPVPPGRLAASHLWRGVGLTVAAAAVVAGALALVLWRGSPVRPGAFSLPPKAPPSATEPVRYAEREPAPRQVKAAYQAVRGAYANGGPDALVRASAECAQQLQRDPRKLDECLAFDMYAADILPAGERNDATAWFHDSDQRALALARSALPVGADPADRVEQVRALTTVVLPKARRPVVRPARRPVARPPPPRIERVRHVSERRQAIRHARRPRPTRTAARSTGNPYCLDAANQADRIVCSDPSLSDQDRRVREAYGRASATGEDAAALTREQSNWRAARDAATDRGTLERLYRERLQDLNQQTPPH